MNCESETVKKQLKLLVERLEDSHLNRQDTTPYLGRLFMRIYNEFPGDVGCFIIYFLNHVILEPDEAIYLAPNVPHAYLSGGKYPFRTIEFLHCYALLFALFWLLMIKWAYYYGISSQISH